MSKRSNAASESMGFLLVVGAIFVVLNILGIYAFTRVDLTENHRFTLSSSSKALVRNLEEPMEVTAYITDDLPHAQVDRAIRDLLIEYEHAANGKITLRVVTPDTEEEEAEAGDAGIHQAEWRDISDTEASVKLGYRGIVIHSGLKSKAINMDPRRGADAASGLEYEITQNIKELTGDKRKVGVISGHNENFTLTKGMNSLTQALRLYEVEEVSAAESIDPESYAAVLVVSPETALSPAELQHINQFVMGGGSLGVFGADIKFNLQSATEVHAEGVDSGMNTLLHAWGVSILPKPILDQRCQPVSVPSRFGIPLPARQFALPIVGLDETQRQHPVVFGVPSFILPFSSALKVEDAPEGVNVTVVARSSGNAVTQSGEETFGSWLPGGDGPYDLNPGQRTPPLPGSHDDWGPHPLIVAVEGRLPSAFPDAAVSTDQSAASSIDTPAQSATSVRVLVSGSGLLLHDLVFQNRIESTQAVALNAIDWLANDEDMVAIRAKGVEPPRIDIPPSISQQEDAQQQAAVDQQIAQLQNNEEAGTEAATRAQDAESALRAAQDKWESDQAIFTWGNTFGIPFLFALFGVIRWRLRIAKKANVRL